MNEGQALAHIIAICDDWEKAGHAMNELSIIRGLAKTAKKAEIVFTAPPTSNYHDNSSWIGITATGVNDRGFWLHPGECIAIIKK